MFFCPNCTRPHKTELEGICSSCTNRIKSKESWLSVLRPLLVSSEPYNKSDQITIACPKCKTHRICKANSLVTAWARKSPVNGWCRSCLVNQPEVLANLVRKNLGRKLGAVPEERKKVLSEKMKQKWLDPEYRAIKEKQIEAQWSDENFKKAHLLASLAVQDQRERSMKAHHSTSEFKEQQRRDSLDRWNDPAYQSKTLAHISPEWRAKISEAMTKQRNSPEWGKALSENAKQAHLTSQNYEKFKITNEEIKEQIIGRFDFLEFLPKRNLKRHVSIKCVKCGEVSERSVHRLFQQCGFCFNQSVSRPEEEIRAFIESLGFNRPDKHYIGRKELDVLVQERDIAIEYCGLYWHSEEMYPDQNHHKNKMILANEQGIRLITIFEDEWLDRESQVKGLIRAILGKPTERHYARNLDFVLMDRKAAKDFLDEHHLQGGNAVFYLAVGLADHTGRVLGLMTFGHHHRGGGCALNRMCFLTGVSVVGGASKMLSHAKEILSGLGVDSLVTWSDNRWSDGLVYQAMGMTLDTRLKPDYSYCRRTRRYSKQSLKLSKEEASHGVTEAAIRKSQGYVRIWDCGKKRWKLEW